MTGRDSSAGGTGGGGGGGTVACELLVQETQLSSPKANVIQGLKVGEVLQVEVKKEGDLRLVQVMRKGQLAGGLTSPEVGQLRECLFKGFEYDATVIAVSDGQVRVRVALHR